VTKVIGLTGNVAAGKSRVAELFAAWGATVIDADVLVRQLQRPGEPVFDAIVAHFGPGVLQDNGELDRAALRQRILNDSEARRDLEAIVHPAVAARRRQLTASAMERGVSLIVADIPLLFEADHPEDYDAVVLVDAPESLRRERLISLRGMDPAEADRLMATQLPSALKRRAADFVIDNDGDLELLRERALAVWLALEQR
jgi:dephospho-CoA kinase